ncbi:MAG: hypothetical protein HYU41_23090 [Candidatus Rokubacteria bacterium]|nr:hypothetical protein [Candidatus Rokubacteria bacterium]
MNDFAMRVIVLSLVLGAASSLAAAWVAGGAVAMAVAVGALVAVLNFRWLVRGVAAVAEDPGRGHRRSLAVVTLRHAASFGILAVPVAAGIANPLGLGVGVTALPVALTIAGLALAREEI